MINMGNHRLPFAHLNLRFNPFGELTRKQRFEVAVVDISDLLSLLQKPKQAIQFVADHGRGKSTHLIALHTHFSKAPYTQLHSMDKPEFKHEPLHFIDSIENLSKSSRKKLYKKATSIAITTHIDLSKELFKAGYDVTTKEISLYDPDLLKIALNKRIELARRSDKEIPCLNISAIQKLKRLFGDDIRSMETHLYEIFQLLDGVKNVEV